MAACAWVAGAFAAPCGDPSVAGLDGACGWQAARARVGRATAGRVLRMAVPVLRGKGPILSRSHRGAMWHSPAVARSRFAALRCRPLIRRSEEHTSELQSLLRISYAVFCLKKKKQKHTLTRINNSTDDN